MDKILKGRTAIITGGGRGIGRAIAEIYAIEGCKLALISRTIRELEETSTFIRDTYNTEVEYYNTDISDERKITSIVSEIIRKHNRIDMLVNAASILGPAGNLEDIVSTEWEKTLSININGLFYCIKAVLPNMKKYNHGCIINFSGGGGLLPNPFFDAYSVCKAATVRLTENLAIELKKTNIIVTAIAPSGVNTKMFDEMLEAGVDKVGEEIWAGFIKRKKNGGDPIENPQKLALLIASTRNKCFNGRTISAKYDNWEKLHEHSAELNGTDIYLMRRIMPGDRGFNW